MTTLYSAKSTINAEGTLAYRITKFVDGEVESSYLTTFETCECPAGGRHTCRHREMIGIMIAEDIVNTHWFWNHDRGAVVDFSGAPADPLLRHPDLPAGEALQGSLPFNPTATDIANTPMPEMKEPLLEYLVDETLKVITPATPKPAPQTQPSWRRL